MPTKTAEGDLPSAPPAAKKQQAPSKKTTKRASVKPTKNKAKEGTKASRTRKVSDEKIAGIMTTSLVDKKRLMPRRGNRYIDKVDQYKEQVVPAVTELLRVCYRNKIPVFLAFVLADNGIDTMYHNEILTPTTLGLSPLSSDYLQEFVRVIQGYQVVSPQDMAEFEVGTEGELAELQGTVTPQTPSEE